MPDFIKCHIIIREIYFEHIIPPNALSALVTYWNAMNFVSGLICFDLLSLIQCERATFQPRPVKQIISTANNFKEVGNEAAIYLMARRHSSCRYYGWLWELNNIYNAVLHLPWRQANVNDTIWNLFKIAAMIAESQCKSHYSSFMYRHIEKFICLPCFISYISDNILW